jgi:hypothetical protein
MLVTAIAEDAATEGTGAGTTEYPPPTRLIIAVLDASGLVDGDAAAAVVTVASATGMLPTDVPALKERRTAKVLRTRLACKSGGAEDAPALVGLLWSGNGFGKNKPVPSKLLGEVTTDCVHQL